MDGLVRLNYFNGQRLLAQDFQVEQKYHIEVGRRLNRGLYSPGVVSGLEVDRIKTPSGLDPGNVRVTAGIALDAAGREMVLLSDIPALAVPTQLPSSPAPGYFLVMRYQETLVSGGTSGGGQGSGIAPPSRIIESPVLSWTETWPDQQDCCPNGDPADCGGDPANCAIVLSLVVLDSTTCQIDQIVPGVRQYAHGVVPGVHPVRPGRREGHRLRQSQDHPRPDPGWIPRTRSCSACGGTRSRPFCTQSSAGTNTGSEQSPSTPRRKI